MSERHPYDESIPVLTEVVADAAPAAGAAPKPASEAAPAEGDDDAWDTLEQRLAARVLVRLQDRIDAALRDEIRAHAEPVLDEVVARLVTDLRVSLKATVAEIVTRAVADELQHLNSRN
jgi:hypothetical protein